MEQDHIARSLDATAKGTCTYPVNAARHLLTLKDLCLPCSLPKSSPCTRHRLNAILGPAPAADGGTEETT
jgi:hypothetical protein